MRRLSLSVLIVVAAVSAGSALRWIGRTDFGLPGRAPAEAPPAASETSGQDRPSALVIPVGRGPDPEVAPRRGESGGGETGGEAVLVVGDSPDEGWADVLARPAAPGERMGQALIGDVGFVRATQGPWIEVDFPECPGLAGWMLRTSTRGVEPEELKRWRERPRYTVVEAPGIETRGGLLIPFGASLPPVLSPSGRFGLLLPDRSILELEGRLSSVTGIGARPERVLEQLGAFRQAPYQTGGNSVEAMDGAGLVHLYLRGIGAPRPRDVEGMLSLGRETEAAARRPGDVVFFSTFEEGTAQPGILVDRAGAFIEASPVGGVGVGFLDQMRNRTIVAVRRVGADRGPGRQPSFSKRLRPLAELVNKWLTPGALVGVPEMRDNEAADWGEESM